VLGSITKHGEFIEGALSRTAGKVFVVDEFHNLPHKVREAMLALLEQQTYTRALGFKILKPVKANKKCYKINAQGNQWRMDVRFSCLCTGIRMPQKRINDKAWMSRFIPIDYTTEIKDTYRMLNGIKTRNIKQHKYEHVPVFSDYPKFLEQHEAMVRSLKFLAKMNPNDRQGFIARNAVDMARFAAYFSGIKGEPEVVDWEKVFDYAPIALRNYHKADLTLNEYKILDASQRGLSLVETAEEVAVSREYVSEVRKKLQADGLIRCDNNVCEPVTFE
jgi:hypothetical protein